MTKQAPYGTWPSPLGAAALVEGAVALAFPSRHGRRYIWQESRPSEQGRVALVAQAVDGGEPTELLPATMSARTTVHEYGGRCWAVGAGGDLIVTSNFIDQRLWAVRAGSGPEPLTPEPATPGSVRFAAPTVSPDGGWAVCVRESHTPDGVVNDLVAVELGGGTSGPQVLAQGHDFYSFPAFSPEGSQLAFTCWDHPDMPWDRTQLWRASFSDGTLSDVQPVVTAELPQSALQPRWGPAGHLYYVSDASGWWNLYRDGQPVAPMEAELAGPAWAFGDSNYVFLADGTLVATWHCGGRSYLGPITDGRAVPLELPYTSFYDLAPAGPTGAEGVLAIAGSARRSLELVCINLDGDVEVLRRSRPQTLADELVSAGRPVSFPTGDGERAYGLYYPPHNPGFSAPDGEAPPLIVTSHGGPTSNASEVLNLRTQYWTTRGFAVIDVDYRGSTGYGRLFRRALEGRWGDADVEDYASAARSLADQGWVDPERLAVRGGSSSGLTALAALARYDIFSAATVLFAVTDLAALATGTHKFESRYIDGLVPASEMAARSPVNNVGHISAPVLFLQGLDDMVVPPEQSRSMVSALRQAGVDAYLVEIEGEAHGFRRGTTLVHAQEAELAFYGRAFGFAPAGQLDQAGRDLDQAVSGRGALWA